MILDWQSRRQVHVCRATFSAELFALLDAVGHALTIAACLTEVLLGEQELATLTEWQENGGLMPPLIAVTDAKSVWEALKSTSPPKPAEESMLLHILGAREMITKKMLRELWWADTRDMVADGMTKGKVDRKAINDLVERCEWRLVHECVVYRPQ